MIRFGGLRRDRSAMRRVGLRSLVAAAAVLSVGAALLSPVPAAVEAAAAVEAWPASAAASVSRAQASWVGFDSVAAPAPQAVAVSLDANSVATAQSPVGAGAAHGPVLAQPGGFGDVTEGAYFSDPVAELAALGVFDGTEPESTDGFVGSAFGAGWPLGWCVCAGRRVLGRAGLECGAGAVGGGWGSAALRGALSGGSDEQG